MKTSEIRPGQTYQGWRWKGYRKVISIVQSADGMKMVHFVEICSQRTGNVQLDRFAAGAAAVLDAMKPEAGERDTGTKGKSGKGGKV